MDPSLAPVRLVSIGYEAYPTNGAFAARLRTADVRRLIDVRQLAGSRRRGFSKTALREALSGAGIEYLHRPGLGNPKPIRDLFRGGRLAAGEAAYRRHLRTEARSALEAVVPLLEEQPSALMCLEEDPARCHRTLIIEALSTELGLVVEVQEIRAG